MLERSGQRAEVLRLRTMTRLNIVWQKPYVRIATGLLVLALVGGFEYYFANVPLAVEVPARVVVQEDRKVAVIENPETRSAQDLVLSHTGRRGEVVDLYFDNAVFSNVTLEPRPPRAQRSPHRDARRVHAQETQSPAG